MGGSGPWSVAGSPDRQIDRLVNELYGLTEEEIAIVEDRDIVRNVEEE